MIGWFHRLLVPMFFVLLPVSGDAVVGKLVAGNLRLSAGDEWHLPFDSAALVSVEVRGRVAPGRNPGGDDLLFWRMTLVGDEEVKVADVTVSRPKEDVTEDYNPPVMSVKACGYGANGGVVGECLWDGSSGRSIDGNSCLTVSVVTDSKGMAEILVGEEDSFFSLGMIPVKEKIVSMSLSGNCPVEINTVNVKKEGVGFPTVSGWSLDGLSRRFNAAVDSREGFYDYLDSDVDTEMCRLGGRYRLAVVGDGSGGYDIIYLGGAEENGQAWRPGMIKGKLSPTIFLNHYDLKWYDAEMSDDMEELWGELNGTVMELHFPRERGIVRFSRSRPIR